jgi:hypothetical protein
MPNIRQDIIIELENKVCQLESFVRTPPFLLLYDFKYFNSELQDKWKEHVQGILCKLCIPFSWILDITNTNQNYVKIQFISYAIKNKVYHILSDFIISHNSDMYIKRES